MEMTGKVFSVKNEKYIRKEYQLVILRNDSAKKNIKKKFFFWKKMQQKIYCEYSRREFHYRKKYDLESGF